MSQKTAIIIGAGPAGLTAAYELVQRTDIKPIIFEVTGDIGGIAKTVNYKGNRIDIGGHRFFSKSDKVIQWWLNIFPLQDALSKDDIKLDRQIPISKDSKTSNPEKIDRVMLVRNRFSRIFYLGRFFEYPLSLHSDTFSKLGLRRMVNIGISYIQSKLSPIKPERSLEDFFINRFGKVLYITFFMHYTRKVWGVSCRKISAEWGAQRIKGVSIAKIIVVVLRKIFFLRDSSIEQKKTPTSLIERFMYPKLGPGYFWEEVAKIIREKGGQIHLKCKVIGVDCRNAQVTGIKVKDEVKNEVHMVTGDYFFSTMPIKDLICGFGQDVSTKVRQAAEGLIYRDFITVGLLIRKLKIKNETKVKTINNIAPDTWVYISERDVKLARVQVFNNWSPYLVKDENTVWLGLEYFCFEKSIFWSRPDEDIVQFAIQDLVKIGFIENSDVLDGVVVRTPKAYPGYFGTYKDLDVIKNFTNTFTNLYLIGRNGMHQYNNMDHSMLTAMTAVDNIVNGVVSKNNIWALNQGKEYIESE